MRLRNEMKELVCIALLIGSPLKVNVIGYYPNGLIIGDDPRFACQYSDEYYTSEIFYPFESSLIFDDDLCKEKLKKNFIKDTIVDEDKFFNPKKP